MSNTQVVILAFLSIGLVYYLFWSIKYIWYTDHKEVVEVIKEPLKDAFPSLPLATIFMLDSSPRQYYWARIANQWTLRIIPKPDPKAEEIVFPNIQIEQPNSSELLWRFTAMLFPNTGVHQVYIWKDSFDYFYQPGIISTYDETYIQLGSSDDQWICAAYDL